MDIGNGGDGHANERGDSDGYEEGEEKVLEKGMDMGRGRI